MEGRLRNWFQLLKANFFLTSKLSRPHYSRCFLFFVPLKWWRVFDEDSRDRSWSFSLHSYGSVWLGMSCRHTFMMGWTWATGQSCGIVSLWSKCLACFVHLILLHHLELEGAEYRHILSTTRTAYFLCFINNTKIFLDLFETTGKLSEKCPLLW